MPGLTQTSIENIESGRRRHVTIEESCVLAQALGVPPLLLLFPVGVVDSVEVLPGQAVDTWSAAKWFTGDGPLPTWDEQQKRWIVEPADRERWETGAAPLDLYRSHDALLKRAQSAGRTPDDEAARQRNTQIRNVRRTMRMLGLTPPTLPPALSHLEHPARADTNAGSAFRDQP